MLQTIVSHKVELITALFLLSEMLALLPGVAANSVFQLIAGLIKKAKDAMAAPAQAQ